jgi:AhpD family alkylhydroperoxidase
VSSFAAPIFPRLQDDQVPAGSRPFLEKVKKGFGFIPNLFAAFSNSPVLLEGYLGLDATYSTGTLSPAERQLMLLTASVVNECPYCTAAHSTVAKGMDHVTPATIQSFLNAGFHSDQIGEVLVGVALKTMSNYTHHPSPVEIDSAFKAEA